MSLAKFRTLGRSGLVVSPLALGTMTFGQGAWGADDATSRAIFDAYRAAGGNFIDTADIYSGAASGLLDGFNANLVASTISSRDAVSRMNRPTSVSLAPPE